jgi:uncharacterized protein
MPKEFIKRAIVSEIEHYLPTEDIIIIHGARQVGKTSILLYLQNQLVLQNQPNIYFDLEDSRILTQLNRGVDEFVTYLSELGFNRDALEQEQKRLYVMIDEVQYLENPSSFLKLLADHHKYLKVIVSGSSSFAMKSKFKDSLVGRTVNFEVYPLSFTEFLTFKGISFSLSATYTPAKTIELKNQFYEYLLYGGYPKIVLTSEALMKEKYLQQIIDTYIRKDIRDLASIKNVDKFNRMLEVLASQSGNLLNLSELSVTCNLSREALENYIFLLEQTYILHLVRPFNRNIRSEITKMPKVFFFDTGLMQMLWFKKLQQEVVGSVFETGIYSELIKKYGTDQVNYWRTKDKKEIDFVVKIANAVLPIEAKMRFQRNVPTVLHTFMDAYAPEENSTVGYRLVSLEGEPSEPGMIYPWQL